MQYDKDNVDDMILALLQLTMFEYDTGIIRAWKGQSWLHMERLYEKGYIGNPKSKAKSVVVTEAGREKSEELFGQFFEVPGDDE